MSLKYVLTQENPYINHIHKKQRMIVIKFIVVTSSNIKENIYIKYTVYENSLLFIKRHQCLLTFHYRKRVFPHCINK